MLSCLATDRVCMQHLVPLGTNFCEIWFKIQQFLLNRMHLKWQSVKCWPFCCSKWPTIYRDQWIGGFKSPLHFVADLFLFSLEAAHLQSSLDHLFLLGLVGGEGTLDLCPLLPNIHGRRWGSGGIHWNESKSTSYWSLLHQTFLRKHENILS